MQKIHKIETKKLKIEAKCRGWYKTMAGRADALRCVYILYGGEG